MLGRYLSPFSGVGRIWGGRIRDKGQCKEKEDAGAGKVKKIPKVCGSGGDWQGNKWPIIISFTPPPPRSCAFLRFSTANETAAGTLVREGERENERDAEE